MSNRTVYFKTTNWNETDTPLLLSLMTIANDIMMTKRLHDIAKSTEKPATKAFDEGTQNYLMRLACAQAFEALPIIAKLSQSARAQQILSRQPKVKKAFENLLEYKADGKLKRPWEILEAIRSKGLFHYDRIGPMLAAMLNRRNEEISRISSFCLDDGERSARWLIADELMTMVFCYKLLGHQRNKKYAKALEESTKILTEVQEDFATIAVAFIVDHLSSHKAEN